MDITRRELGLSHSARWPVSAMSESEAAEVFPGATDCHVHIIGPQSKYPMAPNRPYTPPEATVAQLKAMHARLGITRTVLVQPSFYGTDNSCMLDALAQLGNSARGVAVIALNTPDQTSARYGRQGRARRAHQSGIRGQSRPESGRRRCSPLMARKSRRSTGMSRSTPSRP